MSPQAAIKSRCRRAAARLMSIAGLLVLTGCAAPPAANAPRYVEPADVPTAKLVMRSAPLPATEAYAVYVHSDATNCKDRRLVGTGTANNNPTTVALAAGSLATVDFVLIKGVKTDKPQACLLRWSFTPEAGKSYLLQGTSTPAGCTARMIDASNPDAMRVLTTSVRRNVQGNVCLPMAQAMANAAGATGGQNDGVAVLRPAATADDLQGLIGK